MGNEISIGNATSAAITGYTTPAEAVEAIRAGKWAKQIAALRSAAGGDRDRLKKVLPAFLWAGRFTARKNTGIETFSGLLCADIDKIPERVGELHDTARQDPHAAAAFVSPSGTGIKIVFRVPVAADAKQHQQNFNAVRAHIARHYQAQVDEAAKDVARLCFVSHDPAAFYKAKAVPLDVQAEPATVASVKPINGAEIGGRNNAAFELACKCRDAGQTPDEARAAVREFAAGCNPPLPEVEADGCVKSAFSQPPRPVVKPPVAKSLGDLKRRTANDPNELLRTGYLCRAGGVLLAAPTGIGKSSFAIQAQVMFALGRPMFEIMPARPLRSLYIQAENDEGDLAEMRDGVIAGLDLSPGDLETVFANVITAQENARTGRAFFDDTVAPLLELHRPDLLWIDPALSYIGSNASAQEAVGFFLRNLLNPLLSRFNCGCVVVHHTNKPSKGEEKSAWQAGDFAYLGSGSAEWANWARAVLAIRSLGSHKVFELHAGKRGSRIGWKDEDGKTAFARLIGHATEPGVICWREASEDETPKGKPKRVGKPEDLTALVPLEKPIAKALLIDKWKDLYGNHAKGRAFLESLCTDGKLFEWRLNRPGTNAAKLIARKPQPE